jgi:hypothetical protein
MSPNLFAIVIVVIAIATPALAFKVAGDDKSPLLQTDDGQPFPGWDEAYAACINEMRAQKPNPYLPNCNQKVTSKLAQQDSEHQIESLPFDLRSGVRSCLNLQDVMGMRSAPNWATWQVNFSRCQEQETAFLQKQYESLFKQMQEDARVKRVHDIVMAAITFTALAMAGLAFAFRTRIRNSIYSGFVNFLAICMRARRARNRFIDEAVKDARDRIGQ